MGKRFVKNVGEPMHRSTLLTLVSLCWMFIVVIVWPGVLLIFSLSSVIMDIVILPARKSILRMSERTCNARLFYTLPFFMIDFYLLQCFATFKIVVSLTSTTLWCVSHS